MDKYIKITKESLAALANRVSGRLHASGDTLEVVDNEKQHNPSTGLENILRDLVEMRTASNDLEGNREAIEYIDRFLSERALHVHRFVSNGYESVVATTRNTKNPKVMLTGHVDVVPAADHLFSLRKKNGRFYGRGAYDMKYAIAAFLQLVDDLGDKVSDYDFGLMVTADEESGGFDGVSMLLDQGFAPDVAIYPDAGDSPDSWKLERSAKAHIAIEVKVIGISAHGSRPWKGDNAIDRLRKILDETQALFLGQSPTTNTLNIGMIHGGEAPNQVAGEAFATLDIRCVTDEDVQMCIKKVDEISKKHGAVAKLMHPHGHALQTDFENYYVNAFVTCLGKTVGDKGFDIVDSTGASDARFFAKAKIPCIVVGAPGDGYHADNEWVSVKGVSEMRDTLLRYVQTVAKTPKTPKAKTAARQSKRTLQTIPH